MNYVEVKEKVIYELVGAMMIIGATFCTAGLLFGLLINLRYLP